MNAYFDRFTISMTLAQARECSAPGRDAEPYIVALLRDPRITRQLAKISAATVAAELRECGAWSHDELADHDANLRRILWLAASNLREEHQP